MTKHLLGVLCLFAGTAFAAEPGNFKVTGQIRLDHNTKESKTGEVKTTTGGFGMGRGRVIFEGKLDPSIAYKIKFDLDRTQYYDDYSAETSANDPVSRAAKEVKMIHKWNDFLTLEIGRLEVNSMSVEGYYSSMDLYSYSQIYLSHKPGSANGAGLTGNFAGQAVTLQVVNSPGYDSTGNKNYKVENDDMTVSLYWLGNLADGMFKPIVSYAQITRHDQDIKAKTVSQKYNSQIVGVGGSLNLLDLTVELEMDTYKNPEYKKVNMVDTKSGKDDMTSMIASVRYKVVPANLTLIAKYSNDQEKFGEEAKYDKVTTNRYSAAAEWRPNANSFRYHLNYEKGKSVSAKDKKDDVQTDTTAYLVGAAISI